jgi:16S rRNA (cytosine967-C5)-methyltransferase
VLEQSLDRPLHRVEPRLQSLLRLGTYQVLCLDIHPAAVVDESVKLARGNGMERSASFVNAVLRQVCRRVEARKLEFPSLADDPKGHLVHWGSLPEWLAERWLAQLGAEGAAALAQACNKAPPRTIRLSAGVDPEAVTRRLGGRATRWAPAGVTGLARDPVSDPGFERGDFTVQDEASQLVPLLLGAEPGECVVDCCAAPGTKSAQLAEIVGPKGEVIALELHASRLSLIWRSAGRLGLRNLRVLERDAA